jgi:hypothetical protein
MATREGRDLTCWRSRRCAAPPHAHTRAPQAGRSRPGRRPVSKGHYHRGRTAKKQRHGDSVREGGKTYDSDVQFGRRCVGEEGLGDAEDRVLGRGLNVPEPRRHRPRQGGLPLPPDRGSGRHRHARASMGEGEMTSLGLVLWGGDEEDVDGLDLLLRWWLLARCSGEWWTGCLSGWCAASISPYFIRYR